MSTPLKDYRGGIHESTDMWLDIEAAALGVDKQVVVRQILRDWEKKKVHAYKLATKRLRANGIQPELFGDETEEDGSSRQGSRR
jgi:hypothetical protein